jgi:hypothetical protein
MSRVRRGDLFMARWSRAGVTRNRSAAALRSPFSRKRDVAHSSGSRGDVVGRSSHGNQGSGKNSEASGLELLIPRLWL